MWASKTSYLSLCNNNEKSTMGNSFFDSALIKLCLDENIFHILNFYGLNNILKSKIEQNNLNIINETSVFDDIFQKTSINLNDNLCDFLNDLKDKDYFSICLDVIDRIDVEDLPFFLSVLNNNSSNFLFVSLNTGPVVFNNCSNSTILPLSTWVYLFNISGFEVVENDFIGQENSTDSKNTSTELLKHWRDANIFQEKNPESKKYLLLRKKNNITYSEVFPLMQKVLDTKYRYIKRKDISNFSGKNIAFNIHHIQDFLNIRPIIDVIPKKQCFFFMRKSFLNIDEEELILRFCNRCGVVAILYNTIQEIDWQALSIDTVVSAAESSAAPNHALSSQFIEAAKINGAKTILLQHGIWIEAMIDRQIYFSSDYIFSWGREHQDFFSQHGHLVAGVPTNIGSTERNQFIPAGFPKFCDATLLPNAEILKWRLGINTDAYENVVLVGTNLRWSAHKVFMEHIIVNIRKMIEANPHILFIIKPHPSERFYNYSSWGEKNCIVLDDILLGEMDLSISRLVGGVSTVVSSLSTLLLDGAVSGKRCIQYDTLAAYHYKHCKAFPAEELADIINKNDIKSFSNEEFKKYYNDADNTAFYEVFSKTVSNLKSKECNAHAYSLLKTTEDVWIFHRQPLIKEIENFRVEQDKLIKDKEKYLQDQDTLISAYNASVVEKEILQTRINTINSILKNKQDKIDALMHSTSWRITAPLRKIMKLFHLK